MGERCILRKSDAEQIQARKKKRKQRSSRAQNPVLELGVSTWASGRSLRKIEGRRENRYLEGGSVIEKLGAGAQEGGSIGGRAGCELGSVHFLNSKMMDGDKRLDENRPAKGSVKREVVG